MNVDPFNKNPLPVYVFPSLMKPLQFSGKLLLSMHFLLFFSLSCVYSSKAS